MKSVYGATYLGHGSDHDTYRAANGIKLYDCSTHWTIKPHDIAHLDALTCGQNVIPVTHK